MSWYLMPAAELAAVRPEGYAEEILRFEKRLRPPVERRKSFKIIIHVFVYIKLLINMLIFNMSFPLC